MIEIDFSHQLMFTQWTLATVLTAFFHYFMLDSFVIDLNILSGYFLLNNGKGKKWKEHKNNKKKKFEQKCHTLCSDNKWNKLKIQVLV